MKSFGLLFVVIMLGLLNLSFADETQLPQKNCYIKITSFYKTGDIKEKFKSFNMASKEKCENIRSLYSQNFSPKEITKVEARMEWKE